MQLRKRICVAFAVLLVLYLVALWSLHSLRPLVRVTFLCATNDVGNGRAGVIQVVNDQSEPVILMAGWYVPATRDDLSLVRDTPLASICGDTSRLTFTAQSTNIIRVSMPTNGGPYKLVFQCVPDSLDPSRTPWTLRHRMVDLAISRFHPSQRTVVRLMGGLFAVSQSIDVGL
jgi:hypothetical protein